MVSVSAYSTNNKRRLINFFAEWRKFSIKLFSVLLIVGITVPQPSYGITVREEEKLSREFLKYAKFNLKIIEDPFITDYVTRIGNKIVATLPPQPFKYHFYVVKEDVYNAFAGPAGNIFINSGLIEAMETEEELAGILGHEIAHVACRHISDMIDRSKKIELATLAGIVASIFLGAGGNAEASSAALQTTLAAGQTIALAYSRESEMQADQLGLQYLKNSGYGATGLLTALKKIRSKNWFGSEQVPTYLMTHPATEDRIAYISSWLMEKKNMAKEPVTSPDFSMAHTRITALYGNKELSMKKFESRVSSQKSDPLSHYGYGLILARTGSLKDAAEQIKIALKQRPFDAPILTDLGRVYFLEGKYDQSLKILKSAAGLSEYDPDCHYYIGRNQIKLGNLSEALTIFETLINKKPYYPDAYLYLGQIYHEKKQPGESAYYLGIHYKNKREYQNAEFHLQNALKHLKDADKIEKAKKILKQIRKYITKKTLMD